MPKEIKLKKFWCWHLKLVLPNSKTHFVASSFLPEDAVGDISYEQDWESLSRSLRQNMVENKTLFPSGSHYQLVIESKLEEMLQTGAF